MSTASTTHCTICGREIARPRRRIWISHWTEVLLHGRDPVEIQSLCRACSRRERRKTLLYVAIVLLAILIATILIMRAFAAGP